MIIFELLMVAINSIIEDLGSKSIQDEPYIYRGNSHSRDSIQDIGMPEGGRGLAEYEATLNFNRDELRNKTVLDLGAGPKLKLYNELKDIGARVISMSPDFSNPVHAIRARISTDLQGKDNMVAAVGQRIPFQDETFDAVFALNCHIPFGTTILRATLTEMARILKKGGTARIGPFYEVPHHPNLFRKFIEMDPNMTEVLNHYRVQTIAEAIPTSIVPMMLVSDYDGDKAMEPSFKIVMRKSI